MRLTCEEGIECYKQIIGEIDISEEAIGNARQSSFELGMIAVAKKDVKEVIKIYSRDAYNFGDTKDDDIFS